MEPDIFYQCLCEQAVLTAIAANILETRDDPYSKKNIFEIDEISKVIEYVLSYPPSTLEIGLNEDSMYVAESYLSLPRQTTNSLAREFWEEHLSAADYVRDNWSNFYCQISELDKQKIKQAVEQALLTRDSEPSFVKL